jgi:hypothetical protein
VKHNLAAQVAKKHYGKEKESSKEEEGCKKASLMRHCSETSLERYPLERKTADFVGAFSFLG